MPDPLTQKDIEYGLKQLGLEHGTAVEVHSSLRSLGYVEGSSSGSMPGGASTVIQALMNVVGEEGAIVMSAYLVSPLLPLTEEEKAAGLIAKVRFLAEDEDCRSGMGLIPDTFRQWPGTCLGTGIHRVCAWGRAAHRHSQGYDYLLSIDGWVLLIGVDINRCSCMHIAERTVPFPQQIIDHFRLPEAIQRRYPASEWYVQYRDPAKPVPVDAWGKVMDEAKRRGLVRQGMIGQARCLFFKARSVVNIYEDFLRTDPFTLFGVDR